IEAEILKRYRVHQLPANAYLELFREAQRERVAGGRIYDSHIAEIARRADSRTVVTDNRHHFTVLLRHGIRVLTADARQIARRVPLLSVGLKRNRYAFSITHYKWLLED